MAANSGPLSIRASLLAKLYLKYMPGARYSSNEILTTVHALYLERIFRCARTF